MSFDFFCNASCTEPPVEYEEFGLYDISDSNQPAFSTVSNDTRWIATVLNKEKHLIQFTGIDHNDYFKGVFPAESKCDGLLYYKNDVFKSVVFVELKTGTNTTKWVYKAKKQLLNTIKKFSDNHKVSMFKDRKAYASNSIDENTAVPRQNDIDDFMAEGFDFYVSSVIEL